MTHIALSQICDEMVQQNSAIAEDVCTTIKNIVSPIVDKVDGAEKWDEAIIIMVYVRKWNDIIVSWECVERISSTITPTDRIVAKDRFNYLLNRKNDDDIED